MKKKILSCVEKFISAILSTASALGFFVVGNLIGNIISDMELSKESTVLIAIASIAVVFVLTNFMLDIRYMRLGILAEELEIEKEMYAGDAVDEDMNVNTENEESEENV